jgi:hypothetical protein
LRAARTRFASSVSMRTSASFINTRSTPEIVWTSESRAVWIQKFIESSPTSRAASHCSRTRRWRSGWMFARNTVFAEREPWDSLGSNSPNTPSCVSSVWAVFRSYS